MNLPILAGPRLTLRRMTHEDDLDLLRSWGDADVMAFMARRPLADQEAARRFIDHVHDGEARSTLWQWGIDVDGEVVGTVTLADVDPGNPASLALLQSLGFIREGLLRERHFFNSEVQDSVILGLLARDWRSGPHSRSD